MQLKNTNKKTHCFWHHRHSIDRLLVVVPRIAAFVFVCFDTVGTYLHAHMRNVEACRDQMLLRGKIYPSGKSRLLRLPDNKHRRRTYIFGNGLPFNVFSWTSHSLSGPVQHAGKVTDQGFQTMIGTVINSCCSY